MKASIGIFQKSIEQTQQTQPEVPDEVFEAALRVIESKGCEVVKTNEGLYLIKFNENGPYETHMSDEWLPVYIAKAVRWISGGISVSQRDQFVQEKEKIA